MQVQRISIVKIPYLNNSIIPSKICYPQFNAEILRIVRTTTELNDFPNKRKELWQNMIKVIPPLHEILLIKYIEEILVSLAGGLFCDSLGFRNPVEFRIFLIDSLFLKTKILLIGINQL